jgi:hypothetical protein
MTNKPTMIERLGAKIWFLDKKLHREDGPAIEYDNGTKGWFLYGKRHREDGPAIERSNGDKVWYLNGKHLTEDQFRTRLINKVTKALRTLRLCLQQMEKAYPKESYGEIVDPSKVMGTIEEDE